MTFAQGISQILFYFLYSQHYKLMVTRCFRKEVWEIGVAGKILEGILETIKDTVQVTRNLRRNYSHHSENSTLMY